MTHRRIHAARGLSFLMSAVLAAAWSVAIVRPVLAAGSVSLTTLGVAYTQNFDGLASTGTTSTGIPTGWAFAETGTNANTFYTAGTGSSGGGDTYSFGTAGSTERAFGGLRSSLVGGLVPTIGGQFGNNTGATITSLAIAYTGEQWRLGQNTAGRLPDRLDFQLSTDATSLTSGTWTNVDSLDFSSPVVDGTVGALNGNVAPDSTAVAFTINGLSIAAGASVWIRWADSDLDQGADDGLAIDDFSLTPDNKPPEVDLSVDDVSQPEGDAGTTSFDFTVSLSAPAGAGGVTFDIGTADDTATVNEGDYAAVALTGQTIPAGSSTYAFSVPVSGDTDSEPNETFLVNVTNVTGATVVDGQGQATIANDDVPNAPPTVDAGGPYTVAEGGSVSLTASGSDPGDTLTYAWDLDDNGSYETAGQSVTFSAALLDGPTSATVHVQATDIGALSATSDATVNVTNAAPNVTASSVAPEPSTGGQDVVASATFGDPAPADTFSCSVSYGDGSLAVAGSIVGSTCTGPSHAYAAFGQYTVTVSVTDDDGDTGSATSSHAVAFDFAGFSGPVDNLPLRNSMNSGAAVPIMFALGGDQGLDVIAPGYPTSQAVTCDAADPIDTVEVTVSAGHSSLAYDPSSGQYTYVWKTKKSWTGCRLFTLRLTDGTDHQAMFMFTK